MTLTRKDKNPTDNFVVDNFLADEYGGEYPSNNKDEFMEAYRMLESDWISMHKRFKKAYDDFTADWISTHMNRESLGAELGNYSDDTIFYDNYDDYMKDFNKESSNFVNDFVKNDKTWIGNLQFDIEAFDELGWELSLEWH
jgi:hypothetical protein